MFGTNVLIKIQHGKYKRTIRVFEGTTKTRMY